MTKFLVLYRAEQSAAEQMTQATPDQAQAGMEAWTAWAEKAGDAVVDLGSPLAPAGSGDPTIGGYSIMEADDADALGEVLEGHPHFEVGTIDVHECLTLPGA